MKQIKQTYLVLLIVISLFSLAIYSTYAMFTTEINTNNIVSIDTEISLNTDIDEYKILTIDSNSYKKIDLSINNKKEESLYYGVWYELISGQNYNLEAYKLSTSDSLAVDIIGIKDTKKISIVIINNTGKKATLKLGVVTSSNTSLNLSENRSLITEEIEESNIKIFSAAEYLKSLYEEDSKEMYYHNNDLLYYGTDTNNYLIFNQELWQIIGVFDNKLKIISTDSIGKYPYSLENTNFENSEVYKLLNNLYYNSEKGTCYNEKECDFSNNGLSEEARNLVSSWQVNNETITIDENKDILSQVSTITTSFNTKVSLLNFDDYKNSFNCIDEEVCNNASWITKNSTMLATQNVDENEMFTISISDNGEIKTDNNLVDPLEIRPVILLNENINIIKGEGTKDNPYILK